MFGAMSDMTPLIGYLRTHWFRDVCVAGQLVAHNLKVAAFLNICTDEMWGP